MNKKNGHILTQEDRSKGGKNRWKKRDEARAQAELDFQAELAGYDREALAKIGDLMRTADNDQTQLQAARDLLDRIHGRAVQRTEADVHSEIEIESSRQMAREKLAHLLTDLDRPSTTP